MVDAVTNLASFEVPNTFGPLQLQEDESLADVETTEEILRRVSAKAPGTPRKEPLNTSLSNASYKSQSFEEGEIDDTWTIVASRSTRRNSRRATPVASSTVTEDEAPVVKPTAKPKRWRRSLWAMGSAAVIGLASFLINRRLRRNAE